MAGEPKVLFVSLTNDIGSDRLVSEFGRQGAACAVLGPPGSFAGLSRQVERQFTFPARLGVWASSMLLRPWLASAFAAFQPSLIVPLDELACMLLRAIAMSAVTGRALRAAIEASLGRREGYEAACHRVPLMRIAARSGARTPWFTDTAQSADLPYPIVIKRDHSSGSGGVAVVEDATSLRAALRHVQLRSAAKHALTRAAGYRGGPSPILFQQFVEGRLAMRTVACRDGVVIDGMSFEAVRVHPTKRASTMLRPLGHDEMAASARAVVAALGCSGFVSFDFILDGEDRAYLIEMNARPIGSTHLGRMFGHDLVHALLTGTRQEQPVPVGAPQLVALFPKELERDPESDCLQRLPQILHDVPTDEPAILAAYVDLLCRTHPERDDEFRQRFGATIRSSSLSLWSVQQSQQVAH